MSSIVGSSTRRSLTALALAVGVSTGHFRRLARARHAQSLLRHTARFEGMRRPDRVEAMLLATVVLWALNFTVTRYALTHGWHPLAYSSLRYSAGALLFSALTYRLERSYRVGGSAGSVSFDIVGDLLAVATAATWAGYSILVAPLMRRYSPYRISAIVLVAGCVPLLVLASGQIASQDFGLLGALAWAAIVFATLGPLVLTNVLWFRAVHVVGPSRATLFANIQPFVAAIFALTIL